MNNYHDLIKKLLISGEYKEDRTGVGCYSLYGEQLRFDLRSGFPLLTTKFVSFKSVAAELLWFLSGSTNNEDLRRLNGNDKPTIWQEWSTPDGRLGPIYGRLWTCWGGNINQIDNLIHSLKETPNSRRHIVTAWNPSVLPIESLSPQQNVESGRQALACCHVLFQMHVTQSGLIGHLYQRSADSFLGVPYNIASYALLTHLVAAQTGYKPKELIISFGDVHLYKNHIEQAKTLLERKPYSLPTLILAQDVKNIFSYTLNDMQLIGYCHHPKIEAQVAV